jgi:hypothetical protein
MGTASVENFKEPVADASFYNRRHQSASKMDKKRDRSDNYS